MRGGDSPQTKGVLKMKFNKFVGMYKVPMIHKKKEKRLNPKTNRMKNSKLTMYHKTDIAPKDRTFKNLPRYSNGKSKVRFQDWLLIKGEKRQNSTVQSYGKSEADGKWYGWSHRAVHGFGKGDTIKTKTYIGKETFKKEAPFTLKSDAEAKELAIAFAREIA